MFNVMVLWRASLWTHPDWNVNFVGDEGCVALSWVLSQTKLTYLKWGPYPPPPPPPPPPPCRSLVGW